MKLFKKKYELVCMEPPIKNWVLGKKFYTKFGARFHLYLMGTISNNWLQYEIRKIQN